jgi:hypothetical protein
MMQVRNTASFIFLLASSSFGTLIFAQSSTTLTQTVNKRNTISTITASPSAPITVGDLVTFTYVLTTDGAPAPTSETIQFLDGAAQLGAPQSILLALATNLIPYSQVDTANGWTTLGTTPTVVTKSANGPDGSVNTATALTFPDGTSGVIYAVPSSTNYANLSVTFSLWAMSASPTALSLTVKDNPAVAASQTLPCSVTSTWQRCVLTYTFPAGSGTGFSVGLSSSSFGVPIDVWGAQFEQSAAPGPYVSTIGSPRPTGAQAGTVSFPWNQFQDGTHTITAQYAGDANFVASTSNSVVITAGQQTPLITLVDAPAGTSVYGQSVTLTAQMWDQDHDTDWIPTGTIQFFDGATSLGTATVGLTGAATITLVGPTSLTVGSHSLTAQYSGDSDFSAITSTTTTHVVTKANSSSVVTTTVSSSLNPSVYGDSVTLSVGVVSSVGSQPTGTVLLMDGATSLGTLTLDSNGNASIMIPLFTAGTHTITVTYSGDNNYN